MTVVHVPSTQKQRTMAPMNIAVVKNASLPLSEPVRLALKLLSSSITGGVWVGRGGEGEVAAGDGGAQMAPALLVTRMLSTSQLAQDDTH